MARKYRELRERMSPEARARAEEIADRLHSEMPLEELRRALEFTQRQLAEALGTTQPNVSSIEQRTDIYISTLRRYIEAMGGRLDIVASFPQGTVSITGFEEVRRSA